MQLTLTCVVTWVVSLVFLVIAIIKVFPTSGVHITQNPYSKNVLLWPVKLDGHWPVRMDFDFVIKSDIVNYARSLTGPHAVIDCGAHIGDGAVPIAAALADAGRGDIIVYALEPDPQKCAIIRLLARLNNIGNIRIICIGLSDVHANYTERKKPIGNSGATTWKAAGDHDSGSLFTRLDSLYDEGEITEPLGCMHLDVEGMELAAVRGAYNVIQRYKPYLSIEIHDRSTRHMFLQSLPGYEFSKRLNSNDIFIHV